MPNKKINIRTRVFKNNNSVSQEINNIRIELCNRFNYIDISDLKWTLGANPMLTYLLNTYYLI